jgi:hypothetical protein
MAPGQRIDRKAPWTRGEPSRRRPAAGVRTRVKVRLTWRPGGGSLPRGGSTANSEGDEAGVRLSAPEIKRPTGTLWEEPQAAVTASGLRIVP